MGKNNTGKDTLAPDLWIYEWDRDSIVNFWNNVAKSPLTKLSFSRLNAAQLRNLAAAHIPQNYEILDFGAGDGDFCLTMMNAGYKVAVYEPSEGRNDNFLPDVRKNKNFLGSVESGEFDCVTCFEVLEHIYPDDIENTMARISGFCKQAGLLFGTVPCGENLEDAFCICPHCAAMFHRWQHMRSFSPESLGEFLQGYGFKVEKIEYAGFANSLAFTAVKK